jgi:acetyl-CoA acetyltransferase family protein
MTINPNAAYICEPLRTPFGKFNGSLSQMRPDDLLANLLASLKEKVSDRFSIDQVEDVIMGDSNGAGEDNRNVARMSLLLADYPETIPGVTVNRLCGSGAEALVQASRLVRTGEVSCAIAGGVESMSRAPWIVQKTKEIPEKPELHQSAVGWRLTNPLMPSQWTQSLGLCAQNIADEVGITRVAQDEWAYRSHQYAEKAWSNGFHSAWVVPQGTLVRDESIRAETTLEKFSELKSAFSENGTITAGNSSPLNDGAVAAFVTSGKFAIDNNLHPLGSILSVQTVGVAPHRFTTAPISAITKLLAKNNLSATDIANWEINEAFAAMVLTVLDGIEAIPTEKVNIHGGAIALGHPIGASAARAVIDCMRGLEKIGGGLGVAAACIGVGQGIAVLVEVS